MQSTCQKIITYIASGKRYPVARFELHSSRNTELVSVALDRVHLNHIDDSIEQIKYHACLLEKLEQQGFIRLEYALPVTVRSDYQIFYDSAAYRQLCALVKEGKSRPGFLFDQAVIRRGRAVLTAAGKRQAGLLVVVPVSRQNNKQRKSV